ncbi:hypothetical protein, partial [Phytopseudomonas straminea]|uniref:hypothetical protein n=1 Tax=Pseudomonas straminea TaxID=47882 RepID=UPI00255548B8
AFFIGALVKGWGEVSYRLYCCEQSELALSSHHPFEYHHTRGFSPELFVCLDKKLGAEADRRPAPPTGYANGCFCLVAAC